MYDPYDDDLPRVVRSRGVAPFWRVAAILGMVGVLGLGFIAFVETVALLRSPQPAVTRTATPFPAPAQAPGGDPGPSRDPDDLEDERDPDNAPYPLRQVGNIYTLPIPGEPAERDRPPSARQRFLELAREHWRSGEDNHGVTAAVVSPDGARLAYADAGGFQVGTIGRGSFELIDERDDQPLQQGGPIPLPPPGAGRPGPRQGGMGGPGLAPMKPAKKAWRLIGLPVWTADSRAVIFAASDGKIRQYDCVERDLTALAQRGDTPAVIPADPRKIVFLRSRPSEKIAGPDRRALPDATEVVVADLEGPNARTLITRAQFTWKGLSVSPDGKKLALISVEPSKNRFAPKSAIHIMDLEGGEPALVVPPRPLVDGVAWTADGQGLVYTGGHDHLPPDYWEEESPWRRPAIDLFHYDTATKKETRLSRGGGIGWCGLGSKDMIYFRPTGDPASPCSVFAMELKTALAFSKKEPAAERDEKTWSALVRQVFQEAGLDNEDGKRKPTAEVMEKIATAFGKAYRAQFKADPPSSLKSIEREASEVRLLPFQPGERKRVNLLLTAVAGEYLRRTHGAIWRLSDGPVEPAEPRADQRDDDPFAFVINVARRSHPDSEEDFEEAAVAWEYQLRVACGRQVVLTNHPAAAKAGLKEFADADLEKAAGMLEKGGNADDLLRGLVERHPKNQFLAIHAAKLLLEHHRRKAALDTLQTPHEPTLHEAERLNLLGVARLADSPRDAVGDFKDAISAELQTPAAYLNLAQAYEQMGEKQNAGRTLRRFLRLFPMDPLADDARRRLAALDHL
jgi:Tol biopolymer transport system component/tetratricopeptide (TPR) repeat protein